MGMGSEEIYWVQQTAAAADPRLTMTHRQCAETTELSHGREKLCHPCASKTRSFVPCLHPVCWLRATARAAGVVLVTGVGACFGDGETAKLVPGIEANDGASVWNVDRPWIGAVGVERYGLELQCVEPIMQWQATSARCEPGLAMSTLCDSAFSARRLPAPQQRLFPRELCCQPKQ